MPRPTGRSSKGGSRGPVDECTAHSRPQGSDRASYGPSWYLARTAEVTIKAAVYARVSTSDQNNAIQVRELTEYVQRRGWELVNIYQDQISGVKASRPGLDRLMADARQRRFDAVLVWKLDRFGRSLVHCVSGIQELASLGVRFIATSQGLDTDESNPSSKLLLHILAAVAQFERELIRERISAGMKNAKDSGTRSVGGFHPPEPLVRGLQLIPQIVILCLQISYSLQHQVWQFAIVHPLEATLID